MNQRSLLLVLLCLVLVSACSKKAETAAPEAEGGPVTPVEVAVATRETMHEVITAEGVLYPIRQANVVGKLSAPVQRFLVQRGDHVRQGQLLAVLESGDLKASAQESNELYQQAEATFQNTTAANMPDDLIKARTDSQSAGETLDAAQKVYQSRVALYKQGALAQKLVEDAKVALVQAQSQLQTAKQHLQSLETVGRPAQLKSAEAQVEAAKAHYANAQVQASYADVRSPISGVVSDRPLNVGEMASAGSALVSIVDISRVVARVNVPVQAASDLRVGQTAQLTAAGKTVPAKITVVSPSVDPNATTVQVWVEAANPDEALKLGTTAKVFIQGRAIPDATAVPLSALLSSEDGGEKVVVMGPDSLAYSHKVEVGVRTPDTVQILQGVKPGEKVITSGGLGLDDKAKVEVSKPEGEGPANKDASDKDPASKDKEK